RGGNSGGDGGFVEVSSKEALGCDGVVETGASHGAPGTFLLDPQDIVVDANGTAKLTDVDEFADHPGTTQNIAARTIANSFGPVILQATNNITFNTAITTGSAAIQATARNAITVNAGIIARIITLLANNGVTVAANVTVFSSVGELFINADADFNNT